MGDHAEQRSGYKRARIRRRVEQRLNERVEFYIHGTIFVVTIVGMWVLWLATGGLGISILWPLLITFGWGIGLVSHGAKIYFTRAMDNVKEREIDRALERRALAAQPGRREA